QTNVLGPYAANVNVYKCPNDTILGFDGSDRIRSISMNAAIAGDMERLSPGTYGQMTNYMGTADGWHLFAKTSDLVHITPAGCYYFADESMYTLNDGYMEPHMSAPGYSDCPGKYDCNGNCFSFVDAHVEFKGWRYEAPPPA